VHSAPLAPRDGAIALRIMVDLASIEVFADKGQLVMTEQIFPGPDSHAISLFATGGSVKLESLIVHELIPAVPN
jgi:fructan beta-fructosidase